MDGENSSEPLKIVFICEGIDAPSSRFRVKPIAEQLSEKGWKCKIIYRYGKIDAKIKTKLIRKIYRGVARIVNAVKTMLIAEADIVFIQRLALPWFSVPEQTIGNRNTTMVFDFDDAVYLNSKRQKSNSREKALIKMYKASSLAIAGNKWLAQHSNRFVRTEVIPTCIDTDRYIPSKSNKEKSKIVIGWMGTSSNFVELELIVTAIQKLRAEDYNFQFRIISDLRDEKLIKNLDAEFEYWSDESELTQLQSFDIGLMPLRDNEWTRCKCSFKVIQYMAVGIPSVASNVGFNNDVITDSFDGFLVSSDGEWVEALTKLMESSSLRKEMGAHARETAEKRFSLEKTAKTYDRLLKQLV